MEPFIGQILIFGGNFPPRGWAFCHGQLLSIAEHQALFSLLGTIYGGDGRTTFALPDLRGRTPIGFGQGPGLRNHRIGEKSGSEEVTLSVNQLPAHTHAATGNLSGKARLMTSLEDANTTDPANNSIAEPDSTKLYSTNLPDHLTSMHDGTIDTSGLRVQVSVENSGSGQAHSNMQPSIALNYIIALVGIYPSRS